MTQSFNVFASNAIYVSTKRRKQAMFLRNVASKLCLCETSQASIALLHFFVNSFSQNYIEITETTIFVSTGWLCI